MKTDDCDSVMVVLLPRHRLLRCGLEANDNGFCQVDDDDDDDDDTVPLSLTTTANGNTRCCCDKHGNCGEGSQGRWWHLLLLTLKAVFAGRQRTVE